jgi:hypothetical protein
MERTFDRWTSRFREFAGKFMPLRGRAQRANEAAPRILAIVPQGPNRLLLESISREAGWVLTVLDTPDRDPFPASAPIIIYDRDFRPGGWARAVAALTRPSPRPYLILLSPQANANLWEELQRFGGSDIVRVPLDRERIARSVERAWQVWLNQQRVRPAGLSSKTKTGSLPIP